MSRKGWRGRLTVWAPDDHSGIIRGPIGSGPNRQRATHSPAPDIVAAHQGQSIAWAVKRKSPRSDL
jgi:hypothetical protein